MRALLLALIGAAVLATSPAAAVPLTIVKSLQTVSDPLGNVNPKAVPGAEIDYSIRINNPNGALAVVSGVAFADAIPAGTMLRVSDLNLTGSGPVEFIDGNVLGLLGSGLTFSYTSLRATGDGVDFSSDGGTTWTYQPTIGANGCDASVTNIRVRMSGTQVAGSSFNLRFRVRVK